MNTQDKVAKLEELLARVKQRSAAPRPARTAAGNVQVQVAKPAPTPMPVRSAPPAAAASSTPMPADVEPSTLMPAPTPNAAAALRSAPPAAASVPPAEPITVPPATAVEPDLEPEVSTEVVEVDLDMDEADAEALAAIEAAEAEEAAAAANGGQRSPPLELDVVDDDDEVMTINASEPPGAMTAEADPVRPANELEEPAPASSPRPIEAAAELEEVEESAPRHTPPPESGKQVAAASLPPERPSSISPPTSVGGHTIIGGWVEPGLGGAPKIGPTGMGVRVPAPTAQSQPPAAPPAVPRPAAPVPPAQASGTRLSPDVTKPVLPASANVAAFEGAAPAFAPATFGDLIDATLSL